MMNWSCKDKLKVVIMRENITDIMFCVMIDILNHSLILF